LIWKPSADKWHQGSVHYWFCISGNQAFADI